MVPREWLLWSIDVAIYARIQCGQVAEIVSTSLDIRSLYHPSLIWAPADGVAGLAVGWTWDGVTFSPPANGNANITQGETANISAELANLQQRLAVLTSTVLAAGLAVSGEGSAAPSSTAPITSGVTRGV